MDETPEKPTAAGYFFTIIAVLGGALLMPTLTAFLITNSPLLLLALTPVLLIGLARYRQQKRAAYYSQEPVAVSQSSTSSGICDNAPWR
jgi:hypothetical protein